MASTPPHTGNAAVQKGSGLGWRSYQYGSGWSYDIQPRVRLFMALGDITLT